MSEQNINKQTNIHIDKMYGNIGVPEAHQELSLSNGNDHVEPKYQFVFTIGLDGKASEISVDTLNALNEWYENKASDIISEMRDENLRGTFDVSVVDLRIQNIDQILKEIYSKIKSGIELTEYETYLAPGVKVLKRDTAFITSAIELFLSNRVAHALFGLTCLQSLQKMIIEILNFSYGDLSYKIPNNRELIALDVFLNSNGKNAKHECFVAYVKEIYIQERFNGISEWDLFGRSVLELGEHRQNIAIHYFMFLAELDLSGFDFSKDSRMLNLGNFWIGLH